MWFHENNLLKLKWTEPCLQGENGRVAELAFIQSESTGSEYHLYYLLLLLETMMSFSFCFCVPSIPKVYIINIDQLSICLYCKNQQQKKIICIKTCQTWFSYRGCVQSMELILSFLFCFFVTTGSREMVQSQNTQRNCSSTVSLVAAIL